MKHYCKVQRLSLKRQLAAVDAAEVEKIIHESGEMIDLAMDRFARLAGIRSGRADVVEQLDRVHDRRQRIAQLMGKSGQELVFHPVRIAEQLLGAAAVGDVAGNLGGADDPTFGIAQ